MREVERDVYTAELRSFMGRKIKTIIREQRLNNICSINPIKELSAHLILAMSRRDQEDVDRIFVMLDSKKNNEFVRT